MFGCIYPDMCIAYNITSSDRSIGWFLFQSWKVNKSLNWIHSYNDFLISFKIKIKKKCILWYWWLIKIVCHALAIWSGCYFHWMASQNRWLHSRTSSCILVASCILQLTANAWQTILISHQYHKIHFLLIFMYFLINCIKIILIYEIINFLFTYLFSIKFLDYFIPFSLI
jgi:hypothetical protein